MNTHVKRFCICFLSPQIKIFWLTYMLNFVNKSVSKMWQKYKFFDHFDYFVTLWVLKWNVMKILLWFYVFRNIDLWKKRMWFLPWCTNHEWTKRKSWWKTVYYSPSKQKVELWHGRSEHVSLMGIVCREYVIMKLFLSHLEYS